MRRIAANRGPVAVVCAIGIFTLTSVAAAAELTPYSLPSQQRPAVPEVRQQAPQTNRTGVDDSFYQKFAKDAATFSPRQRADLEKSFTRSRAEALKAGSIDKAQHYARLIAILEAQK